MLESLAVLRRSSRGKMEGNFNCRFFTLRKSTKLTKEKFKFLFPTKDNELYANANSEICKILTSILKKLLRF